MEVQMRLERDLLKAVGDTPQVPLSTTRTQDSKIELKLEWYNPFGSVKDRPAYWMLRHAEQTGRLRPGSSIIIEPTSGNTGIALAGMARLMGYALEAVVPDKISAETKKLMIALGAHLHETEDDLCPKVGVGTDQAIALAEALVRSHPEKYFMPNQYDNEANYLAHFEGTGPEIWAATGRQITHFVTGIGTGGTITGVAAFLKQHNPDVKIVGVEPQKGHHIQGLRNLEESMTPSLLQRRIDLIDDWLRVGDDDAFSAVRRLAQEEALFVGPSSGAVFHAALEIARANRSSHIVALMADDGRKFKSLYRSLGVFSEAEIRNYELRARYLPEGATSLVSQLMPFLAS